MVTAISGRSRSCRASRAVRRQCSLREGPICCAKRHACPCMAARCRRIVRVSSSRMPTAATVIDGYSDQPKQIACLQGSRAASKDGGRRKSDRAPKVGTRAWHGRSRARRGASQLDVRKADSPPVDLNVEYPPRIAGIHTNFLRSG